MSKPFPPVTTIASDGPKLNAVAQQPMATPVVMAPNDQLSAMSSVLSLLTTSDDNTARTLAHSEVEEVGTHRSAFKQQRPKAAGVGIAAARTSITRLAPVRELPAARVDGSSATVSSTTVAVTASSTEPVSEVKAPASVTQPAPVVKASPVVVSPKPALASAKRSGSTRDVQASTTPKPRDREASLPSARAAVAPPTKPTVGGDAAVSSESELSLALSTSASTLASTARSKTKRQTLAKPLAVMQKPSPKPAATNGKSVATPVTLRSTPAVVKQPVSDRAALQKPQGEHGENRVPAASGAPIETVSGEGPDDLFDVEVETKAQAGNPNAAVMAGPVAQSTRAVDDDDDDGFTISDVPVSTQVREPPVIAPPSAPATITGAAAAADPELMHMTEETTGPASSGNNMDDEGGEDFTIADVPVPSLAVAARVTAPVKSTVNSGSTVKRPSVMNPPVTVQQQVQPPVSKPARLTATAPQPLEQKKRSDILRQTARPADDHRTMFARTAVDSTRPASRDGATAVAVTQLQLCGLCEELPLVVDCDECHKTFCAECDQLFHAAVKYRWHTRKAVAIPSEPETPDDSAQDDTATSVTLAEPSAYHPRQLRSFVTYPAGDHEGCRVNVVLPTAYAGLNGGSSFDTDTEPTTGLHLQRLHGFSGQISRDSVRIVRSRESVFDSAIGSGTGLNSALPSVTRLRVAYPASTACVISSIVAQGYDQGRVSTDDGATGDVSAARLREVDEGQLSSAQHIVTQHQDWVSVIATHPCRSVCVSASAAFSLKNKADRSQTALDSTQSAPWLPLHGVSQASCARRIAPDRAPPVRYESVVMAKAAMYCTWINSLRI